MGTFHRLLHRSPVDLVIYEIFASSSVDYFFSTSVLSKFDERLAPRSRFRLGIGRSRVFTGIFKINVVDVRTVASTEHFLTIRIFIVTITTNRRAFVRKATSKEARERRFFFELLVLSSQLSVFTSQCQ